MTVFEILQQIKARLQAHYGDRLKDVILYGSEARGEAAPDSDVDILCVLDGPIDLGKELRAIIDATYPIQLEYPERIFEIIPCSKNEYDTAAFGALRYAREEGVAV